MHLETIRSNLERLAANYRWTWAGATRDLLGALPGSGGDVHPFQVVSALSEDDLRAVVANDGLMRLLTTETTSLDTLLDQSPRPSIAYCSPEFGITALLPQYAGGLGVLAGDHLKSSSDLGIPLVGVGLFYREGVFRQVIEDGHQREEYRQVDPRSVGALDTGNLVEIPFPDRIVLARVWRVDVGRVPLLLLDTDVDGNGDQDRHITDRLYAGSRQHRLDQEMVLGVGGARALAAMGWEIDLHHLNEGHAGFILLELIDRVISEVSFSQALETQREGLVFTTHTPVPAGIDRFAHDTILPYLEVWAERWDVPVSSIWALGNDPDDATMFNMAALCLRSSRSANGVSQLHGEVSRRLFAGVGIGDDIGFITNGVHARTWTGRHTQELFDTVLGDGWADGDPEAWSAVSEIDDTQLHDSRARSSRVLAALIAERTGENVDPEGLIVGFARRFAPYKRATLFLRRPDLLAELMGDEDRPVHFVFAGKAHPSDPTGKGLVAELIEATSSAEVNGRLTFIPDYEMDVSLAMVQGSDIWLNNPIRPREASGTSGEKAVLNGALNCSVLDGWWAEMFDGQNGWEITPSESDVPETRDHEEATTMLNTIAGIAAEYHDSPALFLGRIRHAWATLGPRVTSARMVREYESRIYHPAGR
jgi:starch phosphorylase